MPSEKRKFGDICERTAVKFLVEKGFKVLERNYLRKWGEIDVIAFRENQVHFIEVKGARYQHGSDYRPEENVHIWKMKRLKRAIQTWFMEHPDYEDYEWQMDVITVLVDFNSKKSKIRWIKNIILE